jgi:hypothetical protein
MARVSLNKPADKLGFQIHRHKKTGAFVLKSPIFLFPLCYQTLNEAVNYARFLGRDRGCEILIKNARGKTLDTIEIDARHNRWLNEGRLINFPVPSPRRRTPGKFSKKSGRTFQFHYTTLEGA